VVSRIAQQSPSPPLIFATKSNSSIIIIVILATDTLAVAFFGEIEFWISTCKALVLVGLLLLGIILDLGGGPTHHRIGFLPILEERVVTRLARIQSHFLSTSYSLDPSPVPHYIYKQDVGVFLIDRSRHP
jgi:amino acid permease